MGENIICSGDLNFNVSSLSFPKASANVEVVDFNISGEKNFHISSLYAKTSPSSKGRYLNLNSDIADLEFDGPVTSQSLHRLKDNVLHYLVPEKVEQTALSAHEEWVVRANIKDTKILKSVFDIPLNFADDTSLEARIGGINNAAFVSFYTGCVKYCGSNEYHTKHGDYTAFCQLWRNIGIVFACRNGHSTQYFFFYQKRTLNPTL